MVADLFDSHRKPLTELRLKNWREVPSGPGCFADTHTLAGSNAVLADRRRWCGRSRMFLPGAQNSSKWIRSDHVSSKPPLLMIGGDRLRDTIGKSTASTPKVLQKITTQRSQRTLQSGWQKKNAIPGNTKILVIVKTALLIRMRHKPGLATKLDVTVLPQKPAAQEVVRESA